MSGQGQYYQQPPPQQTQPQPQQYQPQPQPVYPPQQYPPAQYHMHADIVHRFVALLIDGILLGIIWIVIGMVIAITIIADINNINDFSTFDTFGWSIWSFVIGAVAFLIALLYFSFMESGSGNATIGKKVMHLRVVDTNYQPCSLSKAFVRNICRFTFLPIIFPIILIVDILLVLIRPDKQRLGDIVANTYVIEDRPMGPQPYYPSQPQQPQYYQPQQPPQYQQYPQQQQQQPPQHRP